MGLFELKGIEMGKLKDAESGAFKIFLYGPPGSGKTALVLTLGEKLELLDVDTGFKTGQHLQDGFTLERGEVELTEFDDDPIKPVLITQVKARVKEITKLVKAGNYPYESVCLDSFTMLCEHAMRFILSLNSRKTPQIQDWGAMYTDVEGIIVGLKALPINVIIIAHETTYELDGETRIETSIPGKKLSPKILPLFDEIWRARVKNLPQGKVGFSLQTKSTASVFCRTRCSLPDGTDMDIGMDKVFELLRTRVLS